MLRWKYNQVRAGYFSTIRNLISEEDLKKIEEYSKSEEADRIGVENIIELMEEEKEIDDNLRSREGQ